MAGLGLGTATASIDLKIDKFVSNAKQAEQAIDNLEGKGAGAFNGAETSATSFGQKLDALQGKLSSAGDKLMGMGTKMSAFATAPILAGIGKSVMAASDLNEEMSKSETIFGASSGAILKWSETTNSALGMSQLEALRATGTWGAMFDAMGFGSEQAVTMSKDFTTLSADMASFHNVRQDVVNQAFQRAITGEYESLKQFGIIMTADTVEAKALAMGLGDVNDELTAQDLVLARQQMIWEQTETAQGDFARTSGSLANQLRILKATLTDVSANFGQIFLPYAISAAQKLVGLLEAVKNISPAMQRWIAVIALTVAAIGPLLIAFGAMAKGAAALIGFGKALAGLNVAIKAFALANPLVLALAAIATGLVLAYRHITPFRNVVKSLGTVLRTVGKEVLRFVDGFRKGFDTFRGENPLVRGLMAIATGIKWIGGDDTPGWLVDVALGMDRFADRIRVVTDVFRYARSHGFDPVRAALIAIRNAFPGLTSAIDPLIRAVNVVRRAWDTLADTIGNVLFYFKRVWETRNTLNAAMESIPGPIQDVVQAFGILIDTVRDFYASWQQGGIGAVLRRIPAEFEDIKTAMSRVLDWTLTIGVPKVIGWFTETADDVWGAITSLAGWTWDNVADLGPITLNVVGWLFKGGETLYEDMKKQIYAWVGGGGSGTAGAVAGALVQANGISIGTLAVVVSNWAVKQTGDLYQSMKRKVYKWLGGKPAGDGTGGATGPVGGSQNIPIPMLTVMIGGWLVKQAGSLHDMLMSKVRGWIYGSGVGGGGSAAGHALGGGLNIGSIVVKVADWLEGEMPDVAAKIESWIEVSPIDIPGAVINLGEPTFGRDWPVLNSKDFWLGKKGTWFRDLADRVDPFALAGATIEIGEATLGYDWPAITTKDFWLGKPGTWFRDLVDGEHSEAVDGPTVEIGEPAFTFDWPAITTKDFWFGKPGSWFRNLVDGEHNESIKGATLEFSNPTFEYDWPAITTKDFWFGKPGTWFRDLMDGKHSESLSGATIAIGFPEIGNDWPALTTKDFWLGKEGTWLRDFVDGLAEVFDLDGPTLKIGPPNITWPGPPEVPEYLYDPVGWAKKKFGFEDEEDPIPPPTGAGGGSGNRMLGRPVMPSPSMMAALKPPKAGTFDKLIGEIQTLRREFETTTTVVTNFVATTIGVMGGWQKGIVTNVTTTTDRFKSLISSGTSAGKTSVTTFVADTIAVMGGWQRGTVRNVTTTMNQVKSLLSSGTSTGKRSVVTFVADTIAVMGGWQRGMTRNVTTTMDNVKSGIRSGMRNGANIIRSEVGRYAGILRNIGGAMRSAGMYAGLMAGAGVVAGLRNTLGDVQRAANNIINTVSRTMRRVGRMRSPSQLTMQDGIDLGMGLVAGLDRAIPYAVDAATRMATAVTGALQGMDSVGDKLFGRAKGPAVGVQSGLYGGKGDGMVKAVSEGIKPLLRTGLNDPVRANQVITSLDTAAKSLTRLATPNTMPYVPVQAAGGNTVTVHMNNTYVISGGTQAPRQVVSQVNALLESAVRQHQS